MDRNELKSLMVEVMNDTYVRKDLFELSHAENKEDHKDLKQILVGLIVLVLGTGLANFFWG